MFAQVGEVRYAYHRFGPTSPSPRVIKPPAIEQQDGERTGNASAAANTPVLFIPGLGLTMYMWPVPMLQQLAMDREVIIYDLMGSGGSNMTGAAARVPLTIEAMADSTAALLTKLGLPKVDVWSWSLGGSVAYALLARHTARVDNVVVAASTPGGPDAFVPPLSTLQKLRTVSSKWTDILPFMFPDGARDPGVCALFAAYNSFHTSAFTRAERPIGGLRVLEQQGGALLRFFTTGGAASVAARLMGVPNRVLILHGVQDSLMPIRNAPLAAGKLLGSWLLQFPGEGHGLPFSNVQATIQMTTSFFSLARTLPQKEMEMWAGYGTSAALMRTQIAAALGTEAFNPGSAPGISATAAAAAAG